MGWNNSDKTNDPVGEPGEEMYDHDGLSGWHEPKAKSIFLDLLMSPFVWVGVAALVLVLLVIVFLPGSKDNQTIGKMEDLSKKMEMLENRVFMLETGVENLSRATAGKTSENQPDDKNLEKISNRLSRVEASVNQRLEQFNLELATLRQAATKTAQKLAELPKLQPVVGKKETAPPKTESKKVASKKAEPKYHKIQKGDTLFSLSRTYGISVETIRKLNNLSNTNKLLIGQKLRVSQ